MSVMIINIKHLPSKFIFFFSPCATQAQSFAKRDSNGWAIVSVILLNCKLFIDSNRGWMRCWSTLFCPIHILGFLSSPCFACCVVFFLLSVCIVCWKSCRHVTSGRAWLVVMVFFVLCCARSPYFGMLMIWPTFYPSPPPLPFGILFTQIHHFRHRLSGCPTAVCILITFSRNKCKLCRNFNSKFDYNASKKNDSKYRNAFW